MFTRRRAVLPAPTLYPSFSPADFPATRDAAQEALRLAEDAVAAHPDNPVSCRMRAHDLVERLSAALKHVGSERPVA